MSTIGNCPSNIYNQCNIGTAENGPMSSSRINVDLAGQVLDPADPDPSYINFTTVPQGLYDYNDNNGAYSLTSPTEITINRTGNYNVGLLTNIQSATSAAPIFQIHNLIQGSIGTVPPICSVYCQTNLVSFIPGYLCTQSGDANAYLVAGSLLKVAYITNVQCNVLPTSCISIVLLDGVIGPAGPSGGGTCANVGVGRDVYKAGTNNPFEFRRLDEGSNISIAQIGDTLEISSINTVSTGTNLGTGKGVYVTGSAPNSQYRTLVPGPNIGISETVDEVEIGVTGVVTGGASSGTGDEPIIFNGLSPTLEFSELIAGSNITLNRIGNDIEINSTSGGGGITRVENRPGSFAELVVPLTSDGPIVQIREIEGGQGITTTTLSDRVRIQQLDFRQFSACRTNVTTQNITTTPTVMVLNNNSPPGFLFNIATMSGGNIFNAIEAGMFQISFNIKYSVPIPEVGQIFARLNCSGNPNFLIAETENQTLSTGSISGSACVYLFAGQTAQVDIYSTAFASSTPIMRTGSTFSVLRTY